MFKIWKNLGIMHARNATKRSLWEVKLGNVQNVAIQQQTTIQGICHLNHHLIYNHYHSKIK